MFRRNNMCKFVSHSDFLAETLKSPSKKKKIHKFEFLDLKTFHASKGMKVEK